MSFKLVISFCVLMCTVTFGRKVRILGGQPADIREFPHSVSFKINSTGLHFCGGSIITNRHILTAAHCLNKYHYAYIRIYTGNSDYKISTGQESYTILTYKIHPRFTGDINHHSLLHHDIGVVTIDRNIEFNEYQNKVRLASKNPQAGSMAMISGWGSTINSVQQHPDTLQKAKMEILSNFECSGLVPFRLRSEQICAYAKKGIGACYGDSGVGLINNGEIVGVASFVRPCATGEPDMYTRVYPYLDFIGCALTDVDYKPKTDSKCSVQ